MIFVDTGAFIARYDHADQHHLDAMAIWNKLAKGSTRLLTSNFVLDETFTLIARRAGYAFAATTARAIYDSAAFTILRPDDEDERQALDWFTRFADQRVSFTDCVSFALMRRNRLKAAFAFDRHFSAAGFVRFR